MIYFVTGSSGAGKSTLVKELKALLLPNVVTHDFDELGVPLGSDKSWRIATTRKWIATANSNLTKEISTVVVGLTHPEEVHEIAQATGVDVAFCMLEVEPEELRRRLLAHRFASLERIANLKKYEGVTPEEFFENNQKHVSQIRAEAESHKGTFIDVTHLSPRQTAEAVLNWINAG